MKGSTGGGGEIVQVQGGHILRSTGRKDRHSKVYTAKGPRDRRVRLSAHTAIQFYDVQDRLGYDRPSKAVDWLIKKAQNAIDKLAELPPWNPNDTTTTVAAPNTETDLGSSSMVIEQQQESSSGYAFQLQKQLENHPNGNSSFIPQQNETECIADSMRSFFPTSSGTSLMNFQNYPHDVMSRGSIQTEDLGLSLHTLQDSNSNHRPSADHHQVHFSGSNNTLPFDANYAKTASWGGIENGENRMGFIFSSQSISPYPLFNQSSAIQQREPLQSNYSQLIHAWNNRSVPAEDHQNTQATNHFISEFQVPARIQGEEEEPEELPQRGSMSSSISRY